MDTKFSIDISKVIFQHIYSLVITLTPILPTLPPTKILVYICINIPHTHRSYKNSLPVRNFGWLCPCLCRLSHLACFFACPYLTTSFPFSVALNISLVLLLVSSFDVALVPTSLSSFTAFFTKLRVLLTRFFVVLRSSLPPSFHSSLCSSPRSTLHLSLKSSYCSSLRSLILSPFRSSVHNSLIRQLVFFLIVSVASLFVSSFDVALLTRFLPSFTGSFIKPLISSTISSFVPSLPISATTLLVLSLVPLLVSSFDLVLVLLASNFFLSVFYLWKSYI